MRHLILVLLFSPVLVVIAQMWPNPGPGHASYGGVAPAMYRTSVAGGSSSGSGDRSVAITAAVNDLLLAGIQASANTNDTPTCSDNNADGLGTYTRIGVVGVSASASRCSLFVRDHLVGNAGSTTVTIATGSNTAGAIHVAAFSGMTKVGSAAIRSSGSLANIPNSVTPAPTFNQAPLTANVTVGFLGNASSPAGMTEPSGWAERQENNFSSPTTGAELVTRDSGYTSTTITWGSLSASSSGVFIVELDGSP